MTLINLDAAAARRPDPQVRALLAQLMEEGYGHPGSRSHALGWQAQSQLDLARERIADFLGASPSELIFTSGGTESCALAFFGLTALWPEPGHIIVGSAEHPAVGDCARALEQRGWSVTWLPVTADASVDPEALSQALEKDTVLVSLQLANHEVGTVNDLDTLGSIAREHRALFHVDACLGLDLLPLDLNTLPVDLLSLSSPKLYGPQGVGVLFARRRAPRVRLQAIIPGAQERGRRGGTPNVPALAGFGLACALTQERRDTDAQRLQQQTSILRRRFLETGATVLGAARKSLPNLLNVAWPGISADSLMMATPAVAMSSGAACASASLRASPTLKAMGLSEALRESSLRFSLHRDLSNEEVQQAADGVCSAVQELRAPKNGSSDAGRQTP